MTGFRPSDRTPPPAAACDRGGGGIPDDPDSVAPPGQVAGVDVLRRIFPILPCPAPVFPRTALKGPGRSAGKSGSVP